MLGRSRSNALISTLALSRGHPPCCGGGTFCRGSWGSLALEVLRLSSLLLLAHACIDCPPSWATGGDAGGGRLVDEGRWRQPRVSECDNVTDAFGGVKEEAYRGSVEWRGARNVCWNCGCACAWFGSAMVTVNNKSRRHHHLPRLLHLHHARLCYMQHPLHRRGRDRQALQVRPARRSPPTADTGVLFLPSHHLRRLGVRVPQQLRRALLQVRAQGS
jgi:hypothetical protein